MKKKIYRELKSCLEMYFAFSVRGYITISGRFLFCKKKEFFVVYFFFFLFYKCRYWFQCKISELQYGTSKSKRYLSTKACFYSSSLT